MTRSVLIPALCGSFAVVASGLPLTSLAQSNDASQAPGNPPPLPQVVIIANAPLPGLGLPLNQMPSNVQTANSKDMQRQQSLDLTDYLNNNFSGISISESQDNPFQPDINYHGFTASPLIGTPEGLSIYVDGVRVNESFGDIVNWDLIPESAISNVTLMSGSNPVFGLNTLGGALAVQTKNGRDNPGTQIEGYGGSFGRYNFQAETGGSSGPFDYFVTGNFFHETGWRDSSPTTVKQVFGKVGWQTDKTRIDLSYTWADTSMIGNGTTPQSMLAYRYSAIYSAPDFIQNHLNFINLTGTQYLADHLLLTGNLYYRHLATDENNGDINDDNYLTDDYSGPPIDCSLPPTSHTDNAYCANGINRAATITQRTVGGGFQLTDSDDIFGAKNQLVFGGSFDNSHDDYIQAFQYATITPDRSTVSNINPFNPLQTVNALTGSNKISGVYLTDTLSPSDWLHITASARYNSNTETLNGYSVDTDVGDFGNGWDLPIPLSGDHTFVRLNPAIGFTVTPTKSVTYYADYNQASRAPTVIELGCSNPAVPCGLPNDFASDPDLKQVVAHTFELGARGNLADQLLTWSVDLFHTISNNDIQFVATSISEGYFDNVGDTRRQGFDLALGGKLADFTWHAVYSFVDATYQSTFLLDSESNSTADANGDIVVRPGDRIPLIPRHSGRLVLDYKLTPHWDVGGQLIYSSGAFLHGDENNANQAGGTNGEGAFIMGTGRIGGYTVFNLQSTYEITKNFELFARMVNVFDKRYATAGFLTDNTFNPNGTFRFNPDDWTNENAVSPAQPRAVWAGVRLQF